MQTDPCIVCQLPNQPTRRGTGAQAYICDCERCGSYEWPVQSSPSGRAARLVKMAGYIRDQNDAGIVPILTPDVIRRVEQSSIPRMRDRANRALTHLARESIAGRARTTLNPELLARAYCADEAELKRLHDLLQSEGLLEQQPGGKIVLTPKGHLAAEDLNFANPKSQQGFVAMSFDSQLDSAWTDGFREGILAAGYRPMRIDTKEYVNGISDEIMAEIQRSRFVVADYTLLNNGVYFEAGFAVGRGIPVIPTCRSDYLGRLHFDIRHINTLKWETPAELAKDLAKRISGVLGDGPLRLA
jgi:hypothetical protein